MRVAHSGEEGLAALEAGGFDLVVTDLVMRDRSGLERAEAKQLCDHMQQNPCEAPRRPDDVGDPASQHYPRPFNPRLPDAHGLPIEVDPLPIGRWAEGTTGIPFLPSFEPSRPGRHVALERIPIILDHILRRRSSWCSRRA